jgi:4-alpha-glucanotransferase
VDQDLRRLTRAALDALGVRRFLLGVHDAAFPMSPGEDVGRGTPHSAAAADLLDLAASLGFDGLQLGPQGATSRSNASPYDGALFSREPLSVALAPLARPEAGPLLRPEALEAIVAARGGAERVRHADAFDAVSAALGEVVETFRRLRAAGAPAAADLARRLEAFRAAHAGWLVRDALYEVLRRRHGGRVWTEWPAAEDRALLAPGPGEEGDAARRLDALAARHEPDLEAYALVQLLAHEQHAAFRVRARSLGLRLFADLQVGLSERDAWAAQRFVLPGWRLGAPPSRTDPEGQAWGFAVLDPRALRAPDGGDGPALAFFRARVAKLLAEHDGVRVDHPHGLVTPWVYRPGDDPDAAVREGARLLDSPAVPEHPALAAFAIARPEQIDPAVPRHADGWVTSLDDAQVERYAVLLDAVVAAAPDRRDVACEILSTQPYPLRRVVERHGLGRFRVTQKTSLDDPADPYRPEDAAPADWLMLGSHDTPPIRLVAERWRADRSAPARARRLAARLLAPGEDREAWARATAADAGALAQAAFAELFVGPARHVMVYFTDLLGERAPYNVPGTVSDANWSLRVPPDFRRVYAERLAAGAALDVPAALARALLARGRAPDDPLVRALRARARAGA